MNFPALMASRLGGMYSRLGEPATHQPAGGGVQTALQVIFDTGGGAAGLEGLMQGDSPEVRVCSASVPGGVVQAGDTFVIGIRTWRARQRGVPLNEGSELRVPLALVA